MKDTTTSDQDAGGPVPLAHKGISDLAGISLGPHLRGPPMQGRESPGAYLRGSLGLPGPNVHHPLHIAALTSSMYAPHLLGPNFSPAAFMASLSGQGRGRPPLPPPLIPSSMTLAPGEAPQHHADLFALLKDSARQQELLLALSKLSPSTASSSSALHRPHYQASPPPPPRPRSEAASPQRASSLSPSSYLTPRSLNGSPSAAPSFSSRMLALSSFSSPENLSPTSPPGGEDAAARPSSAGATPVARRAGPTPRPDRVFTCRTCNRSFGYKHVLQNHERTHTGEKPFECRECHKRFTRDHHLKTHMRLHTGEKPYHCTHCDRQFVQVANLRRHLRVHTGERPYSCEACPSRFSDSNQLKAHLLIHKGEKPYGCGGCRTSFRRRHHLAQHKCPGDAEPPEEGFDAMFANDDDDGELTDDGVASPIGTVLSSSMTVLADEDGGLLPEKRRERKSREPRRLALCKDPLPLTPLPEQTEPEDLSMGGSRGSREAPGTYRANIAVSYPVQYPAGPRGAEAQDPVIVEAKGVKPLGFNPLN